MVSFLLLKWILYGGYFKIIRDRGNKLWLIWWGIWNWRERKLWKFRRNKITQKLNLRKFVTRLAWK